MSDTNTYEDLANPAPDRTIGDAESPEAPEDTGDGTDDVSADGATQPSADLPGDVPDEIEIEDDGMPPTDLIREAMKAVIDPEIGYNVVDLGLLYDIDKGEDGHLDVTMTLTTMGCPLTELIQQQVTVILGSLPGVETVDVEFTFSPPWSTDMMSDDVREELRAMGMNV